MENGAFKDVFPIKHEDFPASYVSLPEGIYIYIYLDMHIETFFQFFNFSTSGSENSGT